MTSPNETNEEPSAQAVFPPVDSEAWRQRVDKELKGARFDDTLVHRTREGLTIQPLYTRASLPSGFDPAARPGQAPFVRGARTAGGWQVAQTIRQPRVGEAASAIGADQERGVELFWLYFAGSDRSRRGIEASSVDDVAVLQQALTEDRSVILQGGDSALSRAAVWVAAARRSGLELGLLRGNWGCDPLARLATFGRLAGSLEQAFRQQADLLAWTLQEAPAMRSALVSLRPYHEAGCTPAQELAFALATGAETLRRLSAAGLAIERIAGQVDFAFCVGRDLFTEIAKLRAARLLWTKVLHAWGCGDRARTTKIHALTSPLEASQIDPWSNLLRVGAQGFAAALGNVDSLVLAAFDEAAGSTDAAGRRLAVSGQHVLAEEAALGRVADPAGGSWYIESLTDTLARAAWQLFREIEECGGMAQGLMDGGVARRVEKSAAQLRQDVDHRRTPIVGTSGFANLAETVQSSGRSQEAGEEAGGRNEPAADSSHPLHRVATDSGNLGDLMQAAIEAADSGTESVTLASAL
ncbi:MAG: methylmalonyl-CoA mutase family protein, partial [Acidobacteriota bacterium]